jgi:hypothetical protein
MTAPAPGGVTTLATDLFERTTVVTAATTAVATLVTPIVVESVTSTTAVAILIWPATPFICRFGSSFIRRCWLGSTTISLRLGLWIREHQGEKEDYEGSGENQNEPAP